MEIEDLTIKWVNRSGGNGQMVIHLDTFLNDGSIARVKKVLKIIRESDTPECEEQLKQYIERDFEQIEPRMKEHNKFIIGYSEKVRFCQKQLENALYNRNQYKKSTPIKKNDGWEHYNQYVKQFREELREQKALLSARQSYLRKDIRQKEFYQKVLLLMT